MEKLCNLCKKGLKKKSSMTIKLQKRLASLKDIFGRRGTPRGVSAVDESGIEMKTVKENPVYNHADNQEELTTYIDAESGKRYTHNERTDDVVWLEEDEAGGEEVFWHKASGRRYSFDAQSGETIWLDKEGAGVVAAEEAAPEVVVEEEEDDIMSMSSSPWNFRSSTTNAAPLRYENKINIKKKKTAVCGAAMFSKTNKLIRTTGDGKIDHSNKQIKNKK